MTQKELEEISFEKLKRFYSPFPEGTIEHDDNPDYLIKSQDKVIGIEVTRTFQESSLDEIKLKAVENSENYIIDEARKIFESNDNVPLEVHVHFGNNPQLIRADKKEIAKNIAFNILKHLPENDGIVEIENNFDGSLHEDIHSISVIKSSVLIRNHWSTPRAGFVQEDFITELQLVINNKNKKYNEYLKKCDICYLLIDAPGDAPSSFFDPTDKTKSHIYQSNFEKTFFVGGFADNYIELKTEK